MKRIISIVFIFIILFSVNCFGENYNELIIESAQINEKIANLEEETDNIINHYGFVIEFGKPYIEKQYLCMPILCTNNNTKNIDLETPSDGGGHSGGDTPIVYINGWMTKAAYRVYTIEKNRNFYYIAKTELNIPNTTEISTIEINFEIDKTPYKVILKIEE